MREPTKDERPQPGDVIQVGGRRVGDLPRTAQLLEVTGEPGHEHFRVRWDDGRESILYPSRDAVIRTHRPGHAGRA